MREEDIGTANRVQVFRFYHEILPLKNEPRCRSIIIPQYTIYQETFQSCKIQFPVKFTWVSLRVVIQSLVAYETRRDRFSFNFDRPTIRETVTR